MLASIFSLNVIQTALELGCIYALVALALFLSYSILNIADLSTDGCFTLGCAVACQVALTGHPFLALLAAMAAGKTPVTARIDPSNPNSPIIKAFEMLCGETISMAAIKAIVMGKS